jgi:hypothetical protein
VIHARDHKGEIIVLSRPDDALEVDRSSSAAELQVLQFCGKIHDLATLNDGTPSL